MTLTLSDEFVTNLPEMDGTQLKIYLYLRSQVVSELKKPHWIECSYATLMSGTNILHRATLRKGIIALAENGWLMGFKRGYYDKAKKIKKTNSYLLVYERAADYHKNVHKDWYTKMMNWGKAQ